MAGYLIKDTTMEERKKIVEESLGNIEATCDGCSQRVVDMYDAYIRGEKELRDINMEFSDRLVPRTNLLDTKASAHYVKGDMDKEDSKSCPM